MRPEDAARLLQAYADDELDPAASLEIEAQLAARPELRERFARIRAMSAAIREKADYHSAPADLLAQAARSLPAPARRARRMQWSAAAAAVIVLLALATVVFRVVMDDRTAEELLASHGRATAGQRMFDVASSDLHTVKPWLSARLPYSPPVADLAPQGFPLAGGRVDYIGGKPVAVLVYARRKHTIEAFVWPEEGGAARSLARAGLNLESFEVGGMRYWLVSDVSVPELRELAQLLGRS